MTTRVEALRTQLALSAALLAVGCAGTDDANPGAPKVEGEPAYVLTSNVWGTDGATGGVVRAH